MLVTVGYGWLQLSSEKKWGKNVARSVAPNQPIYRRSTLLDTPSSRRPVSMLDDRRPSDLYSGDLACSFARNPRLEITATGFLVHCSDSLARLSCGGFCRSCVNGTLELLFPSGRIVVFDVKRLECPMDAKRREKKEGRKIGKRVKREYFQYSVRSVFEGRRHLNDARWH